MLACKREHIPKRRGRKVGSGKRIAALRFAQLTAKAQCGTTGEMNQMQPAASSITTDPEHPELKENASETLPYNGHDFTFPDALLDGTGISEVSLLPLVKRCVDIYLEEMYPIMPIFKPSELRKTLDQPWKANERSMLLARCALITTFLCRRSESIFGAVEWEPVTEYFLGESLAVRERYDYIQDSSLFTLLTSFFLSVTHFELHNIRLCWFYLREAITLAQTLGLHTESFHYRKV